MQLVSVSTAVATVHNLSTAAWIHAAYKRAGQPVYTQLACQRSQIKIVYSYHREAPGAGHVKRALPHANTVPPSPPRAHTPGVASVSHRLEAATTTSALSERGQGGRRH